jgi:hypothetical protein
VLPVLGGWRWGGIAELELLYLQLRHRHDRHRRRRDEKVTVSHRGADSRAREVIPAKGELRVIYNGH